MMGLKHLTRDEAVDLAEGCGPDMARHHLESCVQCQARVADLAGVLARAGADVVPDPSPLFWDHLSARIGRAIDNEPAQVEPAWGNWRRWMGASAVALVVVVLAVTLATLPRREGERAGATPGRTASVTGPVAAAAPSVPAPDDGTWDLVTLLSDELVGDEAESVSLEPVPGSAERAVEELTAQEQGELVRLLEAELSRRPS